MGFDFCIKCNGGGEVLVCKGDDCPVVIHQKCMGCPAMFDDVGKFDCPYCLSRKAYVELNQAREDVRLKKRALSAFIDAKIIDCDREEGKSPLAETGNVGKIDGLDRGENPHSDGPSTDQPDGGEEQGDQEVADNQEVANLSDSGAVQEKYCLKALEENENRENNHDKTASSSENNFMSEEQAHTKEHNPPLRKSKRIKVNTPCEAPSSDVDCSEALMGKRPRKSKKTIVPSKVSSPREPSSSNVDSSRRSSPRIPTSPWKTKQTISRSKVNSPSKPSSSNVDGSGRSIPIIRKSPRKAKKINTASEVSQKILNPVGHKKILWTEEEEEMIKKGIAEYSEDDKNIPWRNILEFGRHVFHSSRNPERLKDKWRTMLAKENLAK